MRRTPSSARRVRRARLLHPGFDNPSWRRVRFRKRALRLVRDIWETPIEHFAGNVRGIVASIESAYIETIS